MSFDRKLFLKAVTDWFEILFLGLRAGVAPGTESADCAGDADPASEPGDERWLDSNQMATGSPVNRCVSDSPGYLTSNGLGSLEIGAADD